MKHPPRESIVGIIPAFNEQANIAKAVRAMRAVPEIGPVLVVDGFSADATVREAEAAGARVILQKEDRYPGKGVAIETAIEESDEDLLVFFDADIMNVRPRMVQKLLRPVLRDECDRTTATYDRKGGRVTELTAKPLLAIYFPEIRLEQPLAGEFCATRGLLEAVELEKDWGIDVGLVIDTVMKGYRLHEVDLGYKEHPMKELAELRTMSDQVARTILKRAIAYGRYKRSAVPKSSDVPGEDPEAALLAGP